MFHDGDWLFESKERGRLWAAEPEFGMDLPYFQLRPHPLFSPGFHLYTTAHLHSFLFLLRYLLITMAEGSNYDYLFKVRLVPRNALFGNSSCGPQVVLIGDSGVGKSYVLKEAIFVMDLEH